MEQLQQLEAGKSVTIKCFVRTYPDGKAQIFGVIVNGAEHLNVSGVHGTQLIAAELVIANGVCENKKGLDGQSRETLINYHI